MDRVFDWLADIWLIAAADAIAGSYLMIGLNQGAERLIETLNPLNPVNYIVLALALAPGLAAKGIALRRIRRGLKLPPGYRHIAGRRRDRSLAFGI